MGLGPNGTPIEVQLKVMHPQGRRGAPLAVFSPGFLLNSDMYMSYAAQLASWGYAVALWDLSEVLDDTMTLVYMQQVIDFCAKDARLAPLLDAQKLYLAGHSRGGKLSCLLAAQAARVKGLCLLDPVDLSSFGPSGPGYPSALPALQKAAAQRRSAGSSLPVLVVGAGSNQDVVEAGANWQRFVAAATAGGAPCWEVVVPGAGHMAFTDQQLALFSMFSVPGSTPDELVRKVSQGAMCAWGEFAVCPGLAGVGWGSNGNAQRAVMAEAEALARLAAINSQLSNGQLLAAVAPGPSSSGQPQPPQQAAANGREATTGARSSEGVSGSGGTPGAAYTGGTKPKTVTATRAQLMAMRPRELKRMLQEHGVDSAGVFEKSELVSIILERCTAASAV